MANRSTGGEIVATLRAFQGRQPYGPRSGDKERADQVQEILQSLLMRLGQVFGGIFQGIVISIPDEGIPPGLQDVTKPVGAKRHATHFLSVVTSDEPDEDLLERFAQVISEGREVNADRDVAAAWKIFGDVQETGNLEFIAVWKSGHGKESVTVMAVDRGSKIRIDIPWPS